MTRTRNIITRIGKKGRVIIDHPVAVGGGERERGGEKGGWSEGFVFSINTY